LKKKIKLNEIKNEDVTILPYKDAIIDDCLNEEDLLRGLIDPELKDYLDDCKNNRTLEI
jgi:hypothetical protein